MQARPAGSTLSPAELEALAGQRFALELLRLRAEQALAPRWRRAEPPAPVSLTVAICTKDRAVRLRRLLASLDALRAGSRFAELEILVVDNASVDASTRDAVAAFPGMRYVHEPRTGLDFARNAALRAARGRLLAFLDDDVVVDPHWLDGLHTVWSECPDAGGFSGLVLPYRLDTHAQIAFEHFGGFGRGFARIHHSPVKQGNRLFPVGVGVVGAGCNMCFDRDLLLRLGGFDEALDTGAPLPGGGDLDIFYRVLDLGAGLHGLPRQVAPQRRGAERQAHRHGAVVVLPPAAHAVARRNAPAPAARALRAGRAAGRRAGTVRGVRPLAQAQPGHPGARGMSAAGPQPRPGGNQEGASA